MPFVEVVPNYNAHAAAPGWAYVPDTGFDPSKAAIVPTGSRKRARNTQSGGAAAASGAELTARQQSRVAKHLAELDKENHRDVTIVVPDRARDVGGRGLRGKMTPGVKRILLSQKTFANHLADEEAAIANQQYHPVEPLPMPRRHPRGKPGKHAATKAQRASASKARETAGVADVGNAPETGQDTATATTDNDDDVEMLEQDPSNEIPFLRDPIPALPSQEEIDALLSVPPLTYSAARAAPSASTAPRRQFCEICGYWGRARCMKCGVRVCGLQCKVTHEETRCLKFYA